jgi:large subunit ribosomal protein L3
MKGIIGKKVGMTRLYDTAGTIIPVTVIEAGPCVAIEIKTKEKNGYSAIQMGFGSRKAANVTKPVIGTLAKASRKDNPPEKICEVRLDEDPKCEAGAEIKADVFKADEFVDITGVTKGRGFQGVVRRHSFAGGRASHGGGWHRKPGSIGQKEWPGNIFKGKRMAGQMGNERRTVQNLRVIRVSPEENLIFVKGAIPGANGNFVLVRVARKKPFLYTPPKPKTFAKPLGAAKTAGKAKTASKQ